MKEVKIEVSKTIATCLLRMIDDEINNQKRWKLEDEELGFKVQKIRDEIIEELKELREQLERKS